MNGKLGEIRRVELRSMWPDEAADFTPWLAREENIVLLGSAIGLELEVEHTEVAVGPYSADILARDSGTGAQVIIENQLGRTNHDHLGKAITYAAALDAGTVIWIAPDFTQEHRKALDWLNENGSGDVSFFGVSVELLQIDSSRPAVRFNVLARPADIPTRVAASAGTAELTEARKLQLEWWTAFRQALIEAKVLPSVRAARAQYWYDISLGKAGIHLSNVANTYDNKIGVRVYLVNRLAGDLALTQFQEWKSEIETAIGQQLQWNPNPTNRDKIIALFRDADLTRRDKWPEYLAWMVDYTRRFRQAFGPRVKMLNLSAGHEEDAVALEV